ncbi:MAG: hypothetical protein IT174_09925 [Acidobacteria bacterium]|nr:hypothetical protein [Acidobacteriota bacterium]
MKTRNVRIAYTPNTEEKMNTKRGSSGPKQRGGSPNVNELPAKQRRGSSIRRSVESPPSPDSSRVSQMSNADGSGRGSDERSGGTLGLPESSQRTNSRSALIQEADVK